MKTQAPFEDDYIMNNNYSQKNSLLNGSSQVLLVMEANPVPGQVAPTPLPHPQLYSKNANGAILRNEGGSNESLSLSEPI